MEVKLMIFGGRDFNDYQRLEKILAESKLDKGDTLSIVSGMARGADTCAAEYAKRHDLTLYEFPADWAKYGRGAGFRRNIEMAEFCTQGLAFWDGVSKGTAHNIKNMQKLGKPLVVVKY